MPRTFIIVTVCLLCAVPACKKEKPKPAEEKPAATNKTPAASSAVEKTTVIQYGEPVELFNGQDVTGWKTTYANRGSFWKVGAAEVDTEKRQMLRITGEGEQLINAGIVGADIYTEQKFKDFKLEFEFMLPPEGNSGVYLMGQYEMQIEHDPAAEPERADMVVGSLVRMVAPLQRVPIQPGHWHIYEIEFRAPRFDATGGKAENAKLIRVAIDGVVLHENVEIPGPSVDAMVSERELAEGPIYFQGSHSAVAFRNIVLTPAE